MVWQILWMFHATWRLRNDIYFGETLAMSPNIANTKSPKTTNMDSTRRSPAKVIQLLPTLPVVQGDVMLRLFFGDLTLYFLTPILQCVRSTCQALETTEHFYVLLPCFTTALASTMVILVRLLYSRIDLESIALPEPAGHTQNLAGALKRDLTTMESSNCCSLSCNMESSK
ncbi:hypothetical protein P3T76_006314 [Phytophthora citrophthora]|uniref:Uncharacterized protein n=1 Tax=Phytophthora citrophthora TaxID=4793 RepID=A0AAD9LNN5_9STRA|nr:hypothetical protein P3T76_006314 [Phytophthora citrophthora]